MTRQERAFELKKRGYSPKEIAELVGWDLATCMRFLNSESVKELLTLVKEENSNVDLDKSGVITKDDELDNLDDRLAIVEHKAISSIIDGLSMANIRDSTRVFEMIGRRRTELAKQAGTHKGEQAGANRAVSVVINQTVMAKLVKNNQNQIIEVDGRELRTLNRDSIKELTNGHVLDRIESSLPASS